MDKSDEPKVWRSFRSWRRPIPLLWGVNVIAVGL